MSEAELFEALQAGDTLPADALGVIAADTFGSDTLGMVWDTVSLERITAHLDVEPRHLQPYGLVHGGVWCSVVESTASVGAGLNAAGTGQQVVGVSNTTDFLRGVRDGRVDIAAVPVHIGRLQQLWQVELTRGHDGKLVARGQVRLQHIDPPPSG